METIPIRISKQNWKKLKKDRDYFQKTINGGKWSINDTLTEYYKILNTYEVRNRKKK